MRPTHLRHHLDASVLPPLGRGYTASVTEETEGVGHGYFLGVMLSPARAS